MPLGNIAFPSDHGAVFQERRPAHHIGYADHRLPSFGIGEAQILTQGEGETVGIDMGLTVLATPSDGDPIANPKALAAALAELRSLDRAIARSRNKHGKKRPSKRRDHLYELRNRQHVRVRHLRRDHHHKATCAIAKTGAVVKVETLNVGGMAKNKRLARSISDAGMAEFVRMPGTSARGMARSL